MGFSHRPGNSGGCSEMAASVTTSSLQPALAADAPAFVPGAAKHGASSSPEGSDKASSLAEPDSRPRDEQLPATPAMAAKEGGEVVERGSQPPSEDGEEEDEDVTLEFREVRGQLRPVAPNLDISPLDVQFSQMRIREEFRCGRRLADSVEQVRAVYVPGASSSQPATGSTPSADAVEASATAAAEGGDNSEGYYRLETPFPAIEVIKWRCKLRDEQTGRPKVDPTTGEELYDEQERWFTLDNRRLYCLQKAAAKVWPRRAVIPVIEIPPGPLARMRELRKFRTLDRGKSVFIGGRGEEEELQWWSWQDEVGLKVRGDGSGSGSRADGETDYEKCRAALKRRPRLEPGRAAQGQLEKAPRRGSSWARRGHYHGHSRAGEDDDSTGTDHAGVSSAARGFFIFVGIYLTLRIALRFWLSGHWTTLGATMPLPDLRSSTSSLALVLVGAAAASWLAKRSH